MKRKVYNIEVVHYNRLTGYSATKKDAKFALKSAQTRVMEIMHSMMIDCEVCNLINTKVTKKGSDIIFKLIMYTSERSFFTLIITEEF